MPDQDLRGPDQDLHDAASRDLRQWLDDRGALWPFCRAGRNDWAADPTGSHAFKRAVGAAPADVQAEWVDWIRHP